MATENVNSERGGVALERLVRSLPSELSPVNLLAYLGHAFGACGCSEVGEMIGTIRKMLEWHDASMDTRPKYDTLFADVGTYYLMAGLLDNLDLAEHGTAIRYPWLTEDGKRLLKALNDHSTDEIESAKGEAYDGCWYGDF